MTQTNLDALLERHHFAFAAIIHLRSHDTMRSPRLFLFSSVALLSAACGNPRSEAAVAQALNDAANEIGGLKNDVSQLQLQIDSLRAIVAKQDTTITKLVAGMPH